GHGVDDYLVWRANGHTDIPDTVGPDGAYYDHVPFFAGLKVLETEGKKTGRDGPANKAVIDKLIAAEALLARAPLTHSYPHSWRSKAPIIFRNTPQWFIPMDQKGEDGQTLREKALAAIDATAFYPEAGRNRMRSMVEGRPDWLVSRQRAWGVPLTLFVHKQTGEVLKDEAVNARILKAVEEKGADVWFDAPAEDFLGPDYDPGQWERVEDILDVWFDSGSTHAFVLEARDDLDPPADLYLEGSDQHRGWFQSSLLESCGTRGRAPYKGVLTHGFLLDEDGRKMSKSLGNSVEPQKVSQQYGAEILRLWVASSDYADDMRIGPEIIKSNVDAYRKLRNTVRYLLGALHGFTEEERLPAAEMPELERYMLHMLKEIGDEVREAFRAYDLKRAFARLFQFCTVDLSAFYFDIRKDALYCDAPDSVRRRAARTVMDETFLALTAWLAPVASFTMEEAWLCRFPDEEGSVHLRQFPDHPEAWRDAALAEKWTSLRKLRRVVTGALEVERREKRIGSSLEAAPRVFVSEPSYLTALKGVDLAEIAITSDSAVEEGEGPAGAFRLEDVPGVAVQPETATAPKCERCWMLLPSVGASPQYPGVCARCADVLARAGAKAAE
ncbi:MAG: class I tRNA ligase family protein, partial [Pseudomonadota bacterium]